jgi:hypothetical protein
MKLYYLTRITEDVEGKFYAERHWCEEWEHWWDALIISLASRPPSEIRGPFDDRATAEAHAAELRDGRKVLAEWKN